MNNNDLVTRDLKVVWHPCTQMKDYESMPMVPIKRAEGVWLEDFEGNRYIDAVSSWWVNLFGHGNPRINAAIREQLEKLEHVILAGFTHEPVVALSERLVDITPPGLSRCFYADNGSSAIEVALKMSFHYWRNTGQPQKSKFITLENGYHGETLGALAVGDVQIFKETYKPLLMECLTAPSPDWSKREPGETASSVAHRAIAKLEGMLTQHASEVSAVIIEPLVQCASGMRMYDPVYLRLLRNLCDRYNVHMIADEIAVGFGRTGTLFACEQGDVSPDFMCLSKGLSGGYMPLSVVLTTEKTYAAFYDDYERMRAFLHSHSFTGNPLGCSAAIATLDIFESDDVIEKNRHLAARMKQQTAHFIDHPNVGEVRQHGMILAIEMVQDSGEPFPWQERRGLRVFHHGLSRGALLRPLGNVVYFMPPYVITESEIDHLATVAWEGITEAVRN